jgi:RNA polymerase sigma-70 factor (family 1)
MTSNCELAKLLHAIAKDDSEESYKVLFLINYEKLVHFANSILQSTKDAEEVVSDFFVNIWRNRKQLHLIESPRSYFYTSVKNLSINRVRSNDRRNHLPSPEAWSIKMDSVFFNPDDLLISTEFVKKIMDCVNKMPPKCKLIFKLIKEEGLKYAEVAALLEISVKTVEAQMAIAFKRIKNCLRFENEFPEIHHLLIQKK